MSLNDTPRADRLYIGLFGNRNSGKSSLINALTGQDIAIVSDTPGTTADPVYKAMELHGIGPVVFIDTAGLDDVGELGKLRVNKSRDAMNKTDVAILVIDGSKSAVPSSGSLESNIESSDNSIDAPYVDAPYVLDEEKKLYDELVAKDIPVIVVINKMDELSGYLDKHLKNVEKVVGINIHTAPISEEVKNTFSSNAIYTNTKTGEGIPEIRNAIIEAMPQDTEGDSITGALAKENDHVLLVMPQDTQAPKGRIILPQVQVIRELLDKKCIITCVSTDKLDEALDDLKKVPDLIITDSQVFKTVYEKKPVESKLTSFSVLMAGYKGDMKYFMESAKQIDKLTESSKVLIAEACAHAPLEEDIGREQIPAMIKKRIGNGVSFDIVAGDDFPDDLGGYDLVITCGACMFNRRNVIHRVRQAKSQNTPMTNYGIAIAYMNGILDKINY